MPVMPNTPTELVEWLQILTVSFFAMGLILIALAYFAFRLSRNDVYWRYRRDASRRGMRYSLVASVILAISAALCAVTFAVQYVEVDDPDPQAQENQPTLPITDEQEQASINITNTPTQTPIVTLEITNTPLTDDVVSTSTSTPLSDAAPEMTITPTISVTETPITEVAEVENAEEVAEVVPEEAVEEVAEEVILGTLTIRGMDDAISDSGAPIQVASQFPADSTRIYVFYNYEAMLPDTLWAQTLLRDGEVIQQNSGRWQIADESGQRYFFFGNNEGYPAGNYEIRLTAGTNDVLLSSAEFMIVPSE